ncbi:HAD family hydrolase [Roseibium sp.]|uniref:HAD family hydrolase n=1 Tax=Roseibium sp. TaxID=1936156 RepID=UPI003A97E23B
MPPETQTSNLSNPRVPDDIDLIIFDCDGVLIDSEIVSARVLIKALDRLGVSVDFGYFKANFLGRSFAKVAASIRTDFCVELPETFEADYRSTLLQQFDRQLQPVSGIQSVLDRLSVKSCVATSSSPERATRSLRVAGLTSYFGEAVFTASEVRNGKPAPDLFLHAAGTMNCAPDRCLVIEDSRPGLQAARAAGMEVLHFIGGSHLSIDDTPAAGIEPPVPFFETWASFFDIAPQLTKRRQPTD